MVSAVDSLAARAFLSRVCVERGLPFVDCGTLGAAASVQPALPHATESWHATAVADDGDDRGGVPVCTIKDHPYRAEHCVWWARDASAAGAAARRSARRPKLAAALRAARAPPEARGGGAGRTPRAAAAAADDAEGLLAGDADAGGDGRDASLFVEPVARLLAAPTRSTRSTRTARPTGRARACRRRRRPARTRVARRDRAAPGFALGGGGAAAAAAPAPRAREAAARERPRSRRRLINVDRRARDELDRRTTPSTRRRLALAANLRGAAFGVPPVDRLRAAQIAGPSCRPSRRRPPSRPGYCALEAAEAPRRRRARGSGRRSDGRRRRLGPAPPARPARWRLPGAASRRCTVGVADED